MSPPRDPGGGASLLRSAPGLRTPGPPPIQPTTLFEIRVGWGVATFLALSALAHLVVASPTFFSRYVSGLRRHRTIFRWVEYSISGVRGRSRQARAGRGSPTRRRWYRTDHAGAGRWAGDRRGRPGWRTRRSRRQGIQTGLGLRSSCWLVTVARTRV
ncbi:hypothetical protein ACIA5D_10020 [Actinoplanes sp. NPDC051513]|uniref:hypothetical protein n=1 Tax=Actinoplanes sp. NPDC051513 TaxID=3363908 RepID=UPI0037935965